MERILHDTSYATQILQMTADTMILVDQDGKCMDIDPHSSLWFLQEDNLLGKNIFELLPEHTLQKILPDFQKVLDEQVKITRNYKLPLKDNTYYFKCIMQPLNGMILCQYRDITERSNVKLQLERTNNELKEIQKAAQIGQWRFAPNDHTFYYRGHSDILCEEDIKAIRLEDYIKLILPEDKKTFMEWLSRNENELDSTCVDYRIRMNEEIYYIRLQCYLNETDESGKKWMEGYIQNITDIQRRRNDINMLTHAINNAKESIFAARKDGRLIFANRTFCKLHSIQPDEDLAKLYIYNIVGDMDGLEDWKRRYEQVYNKENAEFVAYHPIKENSEIRAVAGTIYPVTGDDGEETYWSFTHDISERLRYESQIKRLNRILDTTMENIPAGIVVKDINNDFRYIYRNRESYNRDISSENAIGMNDFDYYPREIAEQKRKEDEQIAATGKGMHWTMESRDKNGNLIILDKQKIMVDSEDFSPIIVSIEWDITQIELMKRELVTAKEKAENSDKLKSAFLANMSHEIRTPLNAIMGFSRIIAESNSAEEREQYYEIVDANNERLLKLINEILDLSKIEAGIVEFNYGPVGLRTLCQEIHDAHVFRCPEGVKLVFEPSDEELSIHTDKNRVFQVFSNLIGNAFKFTTEGSVSYGYRKEGNQIIFHVTDTGMGIEPEKISRVFERFAKLNTFAQGTGLGLSICKTIIERLGGNISVSSKMGKGTTFTFTLPYDASKSGDPEITAKAVEAILEKEIEKKNNPNTSVARQTRKPEDITILIAEDTDSNYDLLNAILGRTYKLVRARDGMEAVLMFEECKPDLILMDIKMPNLDGLEATKIIRELSPDIPIIAQSAYAYEHDRNAAQDAGCSDFLSKPIAQKLLKEKVNEWLSKSFDF